MNSGAFSLCGLLCQEEDEEQEERDTESNEFG